MTRLAMILAAAGLLHAEGPLAKHGGEIFRTTCAVAYCHGSEGTAGRAPQLAGRAFTPSDLFSVILNGKAGTGMPPFSKQLKLTDVEAVTQYVLSLAGPAPVEASSAQPAAREVPPSAEKGRALFFDAVRMGGCGRCHEVADRGSPVGPDLSVLAPAKFRNLREAPTSGVVTVSVDGEEPFPGLVIEQAADRVRVYDLSSALPVLRTLQPAQVHIQPGSRWSHAAAMQTYSNTDLEAISGYLTWLAGARSTK